MNEGWGEICDGMDLYKNIGFPIKDLPEPVSSYIAAVSEFTQTPPEMAGIMALGVLAALFQHRYEVEVYEGYKEPLCLYTVAIAAPGGA